MVAMDESQVLLPAPTVLIADDDPPTRILLRAAITKWGYETIEARNGVEAWNILQQPSPPRLCIVDWLMPEMDGIELCTKIRKELSFHPYIILLTQISGTINIIHGLDAGADEFLSKPFKMAELRSRITVGERIIQYENLVAKQDLKLLKLQEVINKVEEISIEIEKTFALIPVDQQSTQSKQLLFELNTIIETLKIMHSNNK